MLSITFTVGSEKELIENEEGKQEKKKSLCSRIVAGKPSKARILSFKFSLNNLTCSLTRETDAKKARSKSWAIMNTL